MYKLWTNADAIGYERISVDPFFDPARGGNFFPFWPQNFFLFKFTESQPNLWYLGLILFESPRNVLFAEILVFSNFFGFLGIKWAKNGTKV